ncbi:hypothetical protein JXA32_17350 [Candidatus Sumerlaeota bacterium]|nr:hypothetical protein [Candidatus Sumerlaeota bacterium]
MNFFEKGAVSALLLWIALLSLCVVFADEPQRELLWPEGAPGAKGDNPETDMPAITAASTPEGRPYGFVFLQCKLTADEGVTKVYLGRPWRSYARTVFVQCEMDGHIHPEGWHNWDSPEKEKTVFYAEGGNTGPGSDTSQRVPWAKILSDDEMKKYTVTETLKSFMLPEMTSENIPRDTSYTLQSAFAKHRKYHPFIKAVMYDAGNGNMTQFGVCYHSVEGRPLSLDLFSTATDADSPRPAVILIHGGGWSSGDRSLMYPLADYLARHGFIGIPANTGCRRRRNIRPGRNNQKTG